jgi:hypothetical protein
VFIFYISIIKPFLIVELWRISNDESIRVVIKHGKVELTFSNHRTLEVPDKVTILTGFVVTYGNDLCSNICWSFRTYKSIILHFMNQRFSLNVSSTVLFLRSQGVLKMLFIFRIGRSLDMVMFSN